jgi:hypothetical protein
VLGSIRPNYQRRISISLFLSPTGVDLPLNTDASGLDHRSIRWLRLLLSLSCRCLARWMDSDAGRVRYGVGDGVDVAISDTMMQQKRERKYVKISAI